MLGESVSFKTYKDVIVYVLALNTVNKFKVFLYKKKVGICYLSYNIFIFSANGNMKINLNTRDKRILYYKVDDNNLLSIYKIVYFKDGIDISHKVLQNIKDIKFVKDPNNFNRNIKDVEELINYRLLKF
jgi:hypothetical protein